MAKRRLSQQQRRRIQDLQEKRRKRAQKLTEQAIDEQSLGQEQLGLVITHFGQTSLVEDEEGALHRCVARQNLGAIVCGDRVVWQATLSGDGVIIAVHPRRSALKKPGFGGKLKIMAANIDQIVIVSALHPEPNAYLIDRYLVAAELLPAEPVILINKVDLLDEQNRPLLQQLREEYQALGYTLIEASKHQTHGMDSLQTQLRGKTSILVGLSGVGKSSLIKSLLPDLDIRIGALSEASGEGTHTTTASRLYHLPCGGALIDSPGVRDFGLWSSTADEILYGFRELRPFIGHCRFSNCQHQNEPDCAIQNALAEGFISPQRFEHYRRMVEEYAVNLAP